ncbi:MAG: hypothetical protein UW42_C0044G0003 [Candidatus Collierbacteria bacterium GW2011_GWB1_44_197]|nr:MAG: hypothetical protein UW42_C0044G0003 [Candidatus Collierbacteria bacterium GW2011_GWB1_44_197]
MKSVLFKWLTLIALCSLLLASCNMGSDTATEVTEVPATADPNEPVVTTVEAPGSYTGSEGTYLVDCNEQTGMGAPRNRCTATVSTSTICFGVVENVQVEIKPTISISHNSETAETRLFSEIGFGSWVISANPLPYTMNYDSGELTCTPEIVFTVVFPSGGIVTKFP